MNPRLQTRVSNQLAALADSVRATAPEDAHFLSISSVFQSSFGNVHEIAVSGGGNANDPRPRLTFRTLEISDEAIRRYLQQWLTALKVIIPVVIRFEADTSEETFQTVYGRIRSEYPSVALAGGPVFAGNPFVLNFEAARYAAFRLRDAFEDVTGVTVQWNAVDMGEVGLSSIPESEASNP